MRFSIIIPVYNVEKYIDKCMYTVMHQSFEDYEVIVVDDETPDHSMDIVQKYVEAFPGKIQVIHQKNTRQGGARNHGVRKAKGEYILFVDSDDYVALDMLERIDAQLKGTCCDILVFRHVPVSEEGKVIDHLEHSVLGTGCYDPKYEKNVVAIPTGPVNKAFRREFYLSTNIQFPERLLYEDAITRLFYAMASSIVISDDVLYYYVQSSNSSIRREVSKKMLDILDMTDIVIQEFKKRNLYEQFRYPLDRELIYGILYILDRINEVQFDQPIQMQMVQYISAHFPDYKDNPWIDTELKKALDCLLNGDFRKYHYRFLILNKFKDKLLQIPLLKQLNDWRKRT